MDNENKPKHSEFEPGRVLERPDGIDDVLAQVREQKMDAMEGLRQVTAIYITAIERSSGAMNEQARAQILAGIESVEQAVERLDRILDAATSRELIVKRLFDSKVDRFATFLESSEVKEWFKPWYDQANINDEQFSKAASNLEVLYREYVQDPRSTADKMTDWLPRVQALAEQLNERLASNFSIETPPEITNTTTPEDRELALEQDIFNDRINTLVTALQNDTVPQWFRPFLDGNPTAEQLSRASSTLRVLHKELLSNNTIGDKNVKDYASEISTRVKPLSWEDQANTTVSSLEEARNTTTATHAAAAQTSPPGRARRVVIEPEADYVSLGDDEEYDGIAKTVEQADDESNVVKLEHYDPNAERNAASNAILDLLDDENFSISDSPNKALLLQIRKLVHDHRTDRLAVRYDGMGNLVIGQPMTGGSGLHHRLLTVSREANDATLEWLHRALPQPTLILRELKHSIAVMDDPNLANDKEKLTAVAA